MLLGGERVTKHTKGQRYAQQKQAKDQLSFFEDFLVRRKRNSEELLLTKKDEEEKLATLETLQKRQDEVCLELEESKLALEEAKNGMATCQKMRDANDAKEKSMLQLGKDEMERL